MDFDAFSSQEIIEPYDEEAEKKWEMDHKTKVKEHKQREALERQQQMNGKNQDKDDIIKRLDELELMEELENELEGIAEEDDETVQAILSNQIEPISRKKRISHFTERDTVAVSTEKVEINRNVSVSSNSDDDSSSSSNDDDEDIPEEFKELERKAASMSSGAKLKLFRTKLREVQDYVQNMKPRSIEEISHKTDMIFLADHLTSAIETTEDEINCERYLNGENGITEDLSGNETFAEAIAEPTEPKEAKKILKKNKKISFASQDEIQSFDSRDEPSKLFTKKITFAPEDDVKSYNVLEEPSKISSTVIYDHGPVLTLQINHSDAVFNEANEQSDVIRSPVDIYKQFADCSIVDSQNETKERVSPKNVSKPSAVSLLFKTLFERICN